MDSVYVSGMYKNNTGLVTKAIADIPHEKWIVTPGDGSNSLLWMVGHVIWARGNIVRTLGSSWSLDWAKQFARGAARGDASKYPTAAEVATAWSEVSAELTSVLPKVSEQLWNEAHNPPTFDGKVGGFIAFLAFHETYHVGQIGYLRKWLGYSGLVD